MSATIAFSYDRAKNFSVSCGTEGVPYKQTFMIFMCGRHELQRKLTLASIGLTLVVFIAFLCWVFLLPRTTCPKNADKKISNAQHQVNDDAPKKDRQPENCHKLSGLLFVQLMILPIYACISYVADVGTDYMAFFTYIQSGEAGFGIATLALILLSSLVTSTIASLNIFFDAKSRTVFDDLNKTTFRQVLVFIFMFCNFGPILTRLLSMYSDYCALENQ